jgi:hypothetical protein
VEDAKEKMGRYINNSNFPSVYQQSYDSLFEKSMNELLSQDSDYAAQKAGIYNTLNILKTNIVEAAKLDNDSLSEDEITTSVNAAMAKALLSQDLMLSIDDEVFNTSVFDKLAEDDKFVDSKLFEEGRKGALIEAITDQKSMVRDAMVDINGVDDKSSAIQNIETKRIEADIHREVVTKSLVTVDLNEMETVEMKEAYLEDYKQSKKDVASIQNEEEKLERPLPNVKVLTKKLPQLPDFPGNGDGVIDIPDGERPVFDRPGGEEPKEEPKEEPVGEEPKEEPKEEPVGEEPKEEPKEEPVGEEPVEESPYKVISETDVPQALIDAGAYVSALKLDVQLPTSSEEIDTLIVNLPSLIEEKLQLMKSWIMDDPKVNTIGDYALFSAVLDASVNQVQLEMGELNSDDHNLFWFQNQLTVVFKDYIKHSSLLKGDFSLPELWKSMNYLSFYNSQSANNVMITGNSYKSSLNHGYARTIILHMSKTYMYNDIQPKLENLYDNYLINIAHADDVLQTGSEYFAIPLSKLVVNEISTGKGDMELSIDNLESYKISVDNADELMNAEEYVYILDSKMSDISLMDGLPTLAKVRLTKGIDYNAYTNGIHLPGVTLKNGDWNSPRNFNARQRVLLINKKCDGSYSLDPIRINSNNYGSYMSNGNMLEMPIESYGNKYVGDVRGSYYPLNRLVDSIRRGEGEFVDVETFISSTGYEFDNDIRFSYINTDNMNTLTQYQMYYDGDDYLDICAGYTLADDPIAGMFTTSTMVGVNTDELSNPVYVKMDMDTYQTTYYELIEGEYHKYNGFLYKNPNYTGFKTRDLENQKTYVNTYLCVNGIVSSNYNLNFGVNTQTRGYEDCDGNARSHVFQLYRNGLSNSQSMGNHWDGKTIILKDVNGDELSRQTINSSESGRLNSFWSVGSSDSLGGNTYFVEVSFEESGEIVVQFTTKLMSWGLGRFGQPLEDGEFNYTYYNCVDTDGDEFYDQIDFDPTDPNIYGDFDMDGLADNIDAFPFTVEESYSLVKDIESGEEVAINANFSEYDYFTIRIYGEEKGSTPEVNGYQFLSISENAGGNIIISLDTSKNINVNSSEDEAKTLSNVLETREKYNEKGGKGKK